MELRKHVDTFCNILAIMSENSDLECFEKFDMDVFRDRFKENFSD